MSRIDPVLAEIRRRREEAGWSLAELSRRSGVSKGQLSDLENGRTGTSLYTLRRLAEPFELEPVLRPRKEVARG